MIKPLIMFFICLFTGSVAFADIDMSATHAYPVPYNPKKSTKKTISFAGWPGGVTITSVKMEVFDINGDKVISRVFSVPASVRWNARNESGKMVSPGMYIIKLSIEDSDGDFGKKIIRVLIAY
jgi:hypothetical protein